ncbi:MAG: AAA family ATPase [Moraxellaceae bacterium]
MKVLTLHIQNFRSFTNSEEIQLSEINVITGKNNSGKTSVLKALMLMQSNSLDFTLDARKNTQTSNIKIKIEGITPNSQTNRSRHIFQIKKTPSSNKLETELRSFNDDERLSNQILGFSFTSSEPNHVIIPFLSKRKASNYDQNVNESLSAAVSENMTNLAARLTRISNPSFPSYSYYAKACTEILGFILTNIPSPSGQQAGIYLKDGSYLPVDQMGEGVPNIAYLLSHLATAKNKIFLIEEPENDLHPKALKALLDLIVKSSEDNQFIISTHSNIVVQHLGAAENSKLFKTSIVPESEPPESKIEEIPANPDDRIAVLEELGYSFADFNLWDGWLILEESSAERIIRDFLIPWFVPKLRGIRTLAAGGINDVEPKLNDLQRLVVYTHLQPVYRNRTWVRVDNDSVGQKIRTDLNSKFKEWPNDRIRCFDQEQFEYFYPDNFSERIRTTLAISDLKQKREAKRNLLNDVVAWLHENEDDGRESLRISADSIIQDLKEIEQELYGKRV